MVLRSPPVKESSANVNVLKRRDDDEDSIGG
jgi:hypothetical protein